MKTSYRVPNIEEFVQDFAFEYKQTLYSVRWYNWETNSIEKTPEPEPNFEWIPSKVWWLSTEMQTMDNPYIEGGTISWFRHPLFDCPFNLKEMIKENKIRVKVMNEEKILSADLPLDKTIETAPDNFLLNADESPRIYRLFFDFEFTGLHRNTTPISLGIVSDNGKSFYAEFYDYDRSQINTWLEENVLSNLRYPLETGKYHPGSHHIDKKEHDWFILSGKYQVGLLLKEWLKENFNTHYTIDGVLGNQIEFVGDCLTWDWLLMTDLIAEYDGYPVYPPGVNYIPTDICTMFRDRDIDADISREKYIEKFAHLLGESENKHNALWDAKVIKLCYELLKSSDLLVAKNRVAAAYNLSPLGNGSYEDSIGNVFNIEFDMISEEGV